jgi:alkylation response protein AidB-like acyl-CoA dehydrogenase
LNLLYTDVEDDLRSSVRDLLADHCDPSSVIALYDGDRSLVAPLWKALATDLGLAGLLVPEERGGAGASAREAAVVLEELGRAMAPVPFLTSAVVATTVLADAEGDLLAELAAGERTAALAVPLSTTPYGELPAVRAVDGRMTGTVTVTSVAGALEADVLLVPAATGGGLALHAVAATDAVRVPVVSLDMTRQLADVTLDGAAATLVVADAEPVLRRALGVGAALLASEQVGVARWCLDETVGYLKQRRQFGRVVGGFQALKHRLADLATGVDSAVAAARHAAAALAADDPDVELATAVAQAYCSDLAVTAAEEAVQLHGGIGMTWEHPAHLYLKRAKADQIAFGTAGAHRSRLAGLVDLPAGL